MKPCSGLGRDQLRTRLGQTDACTSMVNVVCLFCGEDLTSKPKYNRHKLSSCSSDVVDKWKDVAEACAKEMDMDINLDKYVRDTTSVICRNCLNKYNAFLRDQRKITENIKKGLRVIAPVCDSESEGNSLAQLQTRKRPRRQNHSSGPPPKRLFTSTTGSPGVAVGSYIKVYTL